MDFAYVAKFVADMNRAVKFFRDVLGLTSKVRRFQGRACRRFLLLQPDPNLTGCPDAGPQAKTHSRLPRIQSCDFGKSASFIGHAFSLTNFKCSHAAATIVS